jgi:hypothetical protein
MEKSGGRKSRATVPLIPEIIVYSCQIFVYLMVHVTSLMTYAEWKIYGFKLRKGVSYDSEAAFLLLIRDICRSQIWHFSDRTQT